jgi:hypothetical protein
MTTIHLTPQQAASLKKFLERTELRGWEVPELLDLIRAINPQPTPISTDMNPSEKGGE